MTNTFILTLFSKEKMRWIKPQIRGIVPSPRAGHTSTSFGNKIVFFGGGDGKRLFRDLFILDPDTMTFSQPIISGSAPSARSAHTATIFDHMVIVFGGGDGSRRFKDVYLLEIGTASPTHR